MALDYYKGLADQYADQYSIPRELFQSVITNESSWRPSALSNKGAIGLAQLMPATARELGVNPWVPEENLQGGAKFLKQQYDRLGNWRDALSYYNAGHNLSAGRGYADKILSGLSLDVSKNTSNTPLLDQLKTQKNFSKIPEIKGMQSAPDPGGGSVLDKQDSGSTVKDFFRRFGLWVLAGFLIIIGVWRVIK